MYSSLLLKNDDRLLILYLDNTTSTMWYHNQTKINGGPYLWKIDLNVKYRQNQNQTKTYNSFDFTLQNRL